MVVVDNSDLHHGDYERTACIVLSILTPQFLLARFWSRISAKQLGADDWAAFTACVFALSCNIQTLVALSHGWGRHGVNLTNDQLVICLILHYTFQLTYKITVALNKVSILLLYRRILQDRLYRLAIWTLLTVVSLFAFATCVAGVFQCLPIDKAWYKSKKGHCYNLVDAWYTNAVFSIVTDIVILLLPMHMVYKLQMDRRRKLLLYAMFGLGGFITFTSIMRFFSLKAARNSDTTYNIQSGFWSVVEINVGVICICLPPLRALLSRYVPFLNNSSNGSSGTPRSGARKHYVQTDSAKHALEDRGVVRRDSPLRWGDDDMGWLRDDSSAAALEVHRGKMGVVEVEEVRGKDCESDGSGDGGFEMRALPEERVEVWEDGVYGGQRGRGDGLDGPSREFVTRR